jgi:hypothetical protein
VRDCRSLFTSPRPGRRKSAVAVFAAGALTRQRGGKIK